LHTGGISVVGLQRLLAGLADNQVDTTGVGRSRLIEANQAVLLQHLAVDVMPVVGGGDGFRWEYLSPASWMSSLIARSAALQRLFACALTRTPCTDSQPWSLVVGFDEFIPGNKLAVDNCRKCMVLSFTFLQLGQEAISTGGGWFTPVVLRASVIHTIRGGWPACLLSFLQRLLFGDDGLSSTGCPVSLPDGDKLIFAKLTNILSDGDGLRQALDWKGAGGLKPCCKHSNVMRKVDWQTPTCVLVLACVYRREGGMGGGVAAMKVMREREIERYIERCGVREKNRGIDSDREREREGESDKEIHIERDREIKM